MPRWSESLSDAASTDRWYVRSIENSGKYTTPTRQGERPLAFCAQLAFQIPSFELAQQAANASCMTIPMIESVKGLENCEPIAAVPGVDALFVGVHDLSDE